MKSIVRRLRKLEVDLLPPPETAESRRLNEVVRDIRRRRRSSKSRSSFTSCVSMGTGGGRIAASKGRR
jgi:hypothetical protein